MVNIIDVIAIKKERNKCNNRNNYNKHKNKYLEHQRLLKIIYPWCQRLVLIKQRCNNPKRKDYKYYGGRGIKCLITAEELKELWFRDNAFKMKKPTVDRINNNSHYEYSNCRFIEQSANSSKRNENLKKPVLQYTINGVFIKEWDSLYSAAEVLQIEASSIRRNLNGKYHTAGGFIWKLKNCA
jgi:hypothetical protein